ncbi:DUF3231 family protein [Bacillus sp. FJAT-45350]|uniref:DUF3231 family protein n=1 Tax=Bacillus sp. FJAT-45350 TaxID=2011014 RepID=UPI000BB7A552|nr:DUF3231 family protein [Bacillus sp. FJAT-45350]
MDTTTRHIKLTSSELSSLWTTYMSDSAAIGVLSYFLRNVDDPEVKELLQLAKQASSKHLAKITELFKLESFPLPMGFTSEDINLNAPRLYSDIFYLEYLRCLGKFGIVSYGMAISMATRRDTTIFYSDCLHDAKELHVKTKEVMLSKGVLIKPPTIPIPDKIDFIKKQSFLTGWFGDKRPLLGVEIAHLFENLANNTLGRAFLLGFTQITKSDEVQNFFLRGIEISNKHIELFQDFFNENLLPAPMTWDSHVTESQIPPFSDKLMLFHATEIGAMGVAAYGSGLSVSLRRDLTATYGRLIIESGKYLEDGANITIDKEWMEEPPKAANREELTNKE